MDVYEFLVLGLIPGTEIQISFGAWILISAIVLAFLLRKKMRLVSILVSKIWGMRYHVAAIVALATLSLWRRSHD